MATEDSSVTNTVPERAHTALVTNRLWNLIPDIWIPALSLRICITWASFLSMLCLNFLIYKKDSNSNYLPLYHLHAVPGIKILSY